MMFTEWYPALAAAFMILGAGVAAGTSAGESRCCPLTLQASAAAASLVLLALGAAAALAGVGRPSLIFGALGNPSSGIFREITSFGLTAAAVLGYLAALLRGAEASTALRLSQAGAAAAALLALAAGSHYMMPWRPAWNTWMLALPFFGLALTAAAHTRSLLLTLAREEDGRDGLFCAGASVFAVLATAAWLAVTVMKGGSEAALERVLFGDLAGLFGAAVLCGMAIPMLCAFMRRARTIVSAAALFSLLAGTGLLAETVRLLGESEWHFFVR